MSRSPRDQNTEHDGPSTGPRAHEGAARGELGHGAAVLDRWCWQLTGLAVLVTENDQRKPKDGKHDQDEHAVSGLLLDNITVAASAQPPPFPQ